MSVHVETTPSFKLDAPQPLFDHPGLFADPYVSPRYDVSNDGQRFVVREEVESTEPVSIHVVQNWFAEFKDRERD